jgi:predicted Zn-dependent protease
MNKTENSKERTQRTIIDTLIYRPSFEGLRDNLIGYKCIRWQLDSKEQLIKRFTEELKEDREQLEKSFRQTESENMSDSDNESSFENQRLRKLLYRPLHATGQYSSPLYEYEMKKLHEKEKEINILLHELRQDFATVEYKVKLQMEQEIKSDKEKIERFRNN